MGTYQYTENCGASLSLSKIIYIHVLFSSAPDIPPVPRLKETVNKDPAATQQKSTSSCNAKNKTISKITGNIKTSL